MLELLQPVHGVPVPEHEGEVGDADHPQPPVGEQQVEQGEAGHPAAQEVGHPEEHSEGLGEKVKSGSGG